MFVRMRIFVFCVFVAFGISGIGFCFQSPEPSSRPQTALGSQYQTFQPPGSASDAQDLETTQDNPTGVVTLNQSLSLGLMQNPELASFSWEVRAAQARLIQERLLPNPEIEASVENFGGDNDLEGFDGAETTLQISQLIELGGKRAKRNQVVALEKEIADWEYESKRLDVFADISKSFWGVVAAQEQYAIAGEISAVADNAYSLVSERVKSGKSAPLEEIQSRVTVATTRIEIEQAKRALDAARKKLAAAWGCAQPVFEKVTADITSLSPPPPLENLEGCLSKNPDLNRWDTEMERSRAQIILEDANRFPDLTVGAGPRYYNETDDTAFVMNVSLPIPVFNRNQGGMQESRFHLSKVRENRKAAILQAQNDLEQAYQELTSAFLTADSLMKIAVPASETAYTAALEGYREGKISYLAVLETQRTFFEVKHQYISAIVDYHKSKTDIERLIGQEIPN
ncbi:MAG: TolC family protein [Desulfobacterales bacterium]|nr:TolC family protein [Desulfobacterales bacterium]